MAQRLQVRRISFDDEFDVRWAPQVPEFASSANVLSMAAAHFEPYVIRVVARAAKGNNLAPDQRAEVRSYLAQESQHQKAHHQFNRALISEYRGLSQLDSWQARFFNALERRFSPEFNLACAVALEAIAYSTARWAAKTQSGHLLSNESAGASLFKWHMAEEIEHKSIVYDLHRKHNIRRWRYSCAAILMTGALTVFQIAGLAVIMKDDGLWWHPRSWVRLAKWATSLGFEALPTLALSATKSFHPDSLTDPIAADLWIRELEASAITGVALVPVSGSKPSPPSSDD